MSAYGALHAVLAAIIVLLGLAHLALWVTLRDRTQGVITGLYFCFGLTDLCYAASTPGTGIPTLPPNVILFLMMVTFVAMMALLPVMPWVLLKAPANLPRTAYRLFLVGLPLLRLVDIAYALSQGLPVTLENVTLASTSPLALVQGVVAVLLPLEWCLEVVLALRRKGTDRFLAAVVAFGGVLSLPATVHGLLVTLGVAKPPVFYGVSSLVFLFMVSGYLIRGYVQASRRATGIGGYRIVSHLGRGGMGETFLAVKEGVEGFSREVVLKKMRTESNPVDRARFLSEAKLSASLRHPNIVDVLDLGELDDGGLFIAMERVQGETLSDLCHASERRQERLQPQLVAAVGAQLCKGLAHAHQAGVLHRDIKRANVMVTVDGMVKLIDFGLAQRPVASHELPVPMAGLEKLGGLTGHDAVIGTPGYLAPERLRGESASVASDLFAVGVLLYELLAGHRPFESISGIDRTQAVLSGTFKPLHEIRQDVPEAMASLIDSCLSVEPSKRPKDAAGFGHALAHAAPPEELDLGAWVRALENETGAPGSGSSQARAEAKTVPLRRT